MSPSSGTQRRGGLRGHPAPGKQARPCARAAAMALAARGSLVPVCPTPRAARWRPAPTPAIGSPPSGPRRPCPALACIQPAPRPRTPRAPDKVPAHRPAALGAAPRSTPASSAPAPGRRSRRLLSRNCHADRPLAGVHRGTRPPVRQSYESYPDAGAPWPAALHSRSHRTVTGALQTPRLLL